MDCGVVIEYKLQKVIRPVALEFGGKSVQQIMHVPVESFKLPIPLWVIWSSAGLLDTILATELLNQSTFKIYALV